jgi:hypothetical protein
MESAGIRTERAFQGQSATDTPILPGAPSDAYLRLDVGVSRSFEASLNGRPMGISPYFRLLNSLNRRDGLFYWNDRENDGGPRPVAALPIVPIVGFSWSF